MNENTWTTTETQYALEPTVDVTFRNLTEKDARAVSSYKSYFFALWDMDQYLRTQLKYNNNLTDDALDEAREKLSEIMEEYGISFEDLV